MSKRHAQDSTLLFAVLELASLGNTWLEENRNELPASFAIKGSLLNAVSAAGIVRGGGEIPVHLARLRLALHDCEAAFKRLRPRHPKVVDELLLLIAKIRALDIGKPPDPKAVRPARPRYLN